MGRAPDRPFRERTAVVPHVRSNAHDRAAFFAAIRALPYVAGMPCASRMPGPAALRRLALLLCAALACAWTDVETAFVTVPPVRTTSLGPVELRVSIGHDAGTTQLLDVTFLRDGQPLATESVSVPAGARTLVTHWLEPSGVAGDHELGYEIRQGAQLQDAGALPFTVIPSAHLGPRFFQAGWIDPGALLPGLYPSTGVPNAADLRSKIAAMHEVGMDMIIVTYVEGAMFGWGPFYPSAIPELGVPALAFDAIETILDEADSRGMRVFLGLGRGPAPLVFFPPDLVAIDGAVDLGTRVADELMQLYGHHASLYGWYLTHEMNYLAGASLYYDAMGLALDAHGPEKPLLVSPSGTPIITTNEINQSEVDVFAYQDAVGAGYVPYVYTFDPQQRIAMLDQVFGSYAALHAGTNKHLWSNTESWEMAGPLYASPYPAAWPRLRQQLKIERRHAPVLTTYEFVGFMETAGSALQLGGPLAVDLYTDYRAWLERNQPAPLEPKLLRALDFEPPPP
jgi:hypothetical protein